MFQAGQIPARLTRALESGFPNIIPRASRLNPDFRSEPFHSMARASEVDPQTACQTLKPSWPTVATTSVPMGGYAVATGTSVAAPNGGGRSGSASSLTLSSARPDLRLSGEN